MRSSMPIKPNRDADNTSFALVHYVLYDITRFAVQMYFVWTGESSADPYYSLSRLGMDEYTFRVNIRYK